MQKTDLMYRKIDGALNLFSLDGYKKFLPGIKGALVPFTNGGSQLYWPCLISFLFLGVVSYLIYRDRKEPLTFKKMFAWVLPIKTYFHRSSLIDYQVFALNIIVCTLPFTIIFSIINIVVSVNVGNALEGMFGPAPYTALKWSVVLSFTLFFLLRELVSDFVLYWCHRVFHENRFLWPYHRLHHSAEVLNPFTVNRKHPVYNFLVGVVDVFLSGVLTAVLFSLFVGKPTYFNMFGVTAFRAVFNITGAALRHSNIWLSYGPILSRIIISPAQHQIHHSTDEKHFNKNYGEMFALWDWMFGTLYVPKEREILQFGYEKNAKPIHNTIMHAYVEPFVASFREVGKLASRLTRKRDVHRLPQQNPKKMRRA